MKKKIKRVRKKIAGFLIVLLLSGAFVCQASEPESNNLPESDEAAKEQEADTEIVFDADAVLNKTAAKSALADMHGVFVFRDAFITQEKLVKEAEQRKREKIQDMVLTSGEPELTYEETVNAVLLADTDTYIKDVYYERESGSIRVWIYCGFISICLLCIAIRAEDYIKKRKRKEA